MRRSPRHWRKGSEKKGSNAPEHLRSFNIVLMVLLFYGVRLSLQIFLRIVDMSTPSSIFFSASLKSGQRRAFYERNKPIAVVLIVIVFVAPILGVFLNGLVGLFWGMTSSVLG